MISTATRLFNEGKEDVATRYGFTTHCSSNISSYPTASQA